MWQGRFPRVWRRRIMALGAALLLGWAALPRAPASARHVHHFPAVRPAALAHYLADFSNHVLVYPRPESWAIESERNNVTAWHYEVSYSCGARCAGRAAVTALREHGPGGTGAPRHGPARRHRVLARDRRCSRALPLLPWPAFCEETETELIASDGEREGAQLTELAEARCSRLAALLARCADGAELGARHRRRLHALAAALGATP